MPHLRAFQPKINDKFCKAIKHKIKYALPSTRNSMAALRYFGKDKGLKPLVLGLSPLF
jgi:oligoribonuclease (3'-5' exoribonuclease)